MFRYTSVKEQVLSERRKSERLQEAMLKTAADLEYVAMMADVELEQEEDDDGGEQIQQGQTVL